MSTDGPCNPDEPHSLVSELCQERRGQTAESSPDAKAVAKKAIEYLKSEGQNPENGSYSEFAGPAVTALVTTAMLKHGESVDDKDVAKSLKYLETFVQPDGGIYKTDSSPICDLQDQFFSIYELQDRFFSNM